MLETEWLQPAALFPGAVRLPQLCHCSTGQWEKPFCDCEWDGIVVVFCHCDHLVFSEPALAVAAVAWSSVTYTRRIIVWQNFIVYIYIYMWASALCIRFTIIPPRLTDQCNFITVLIVTREPEQTMLLFWSAACGITPHGLHAANRR